MSKISFKILVGLLVVMLGTGINCKRQTNSIDLSINLEQERKIQMAVDKGHQPWRLDSVSVAVVALKSAGYKEIGDQNCENIFIKNGAAEVHCRGEYSYFIQLKKMVRLDGIWTAISINIFRLGFFLDSQSD